MSKQTLEYQLDKADSILEQAHLSHDITQATNVLQRIGDGLWQFNKIKNPSAENFEQRAKLVEAVDNLRTKHEVLGLFDDAIAPLRSQFVMSLIHANMEKRVQEDKEAKLGVKPLQNVVSADMSLG